MDWNLLGMVMEMVGGIGRRLDECRKRLAEARTAWKSDRLGNGQILEWKPFLMGFCLEFGEVADVVIGKLAGELQYFREIF